MYRLIVKLPDGSSRTLPLVKRITAVGSAAENDVALPLPGVPESALHLELEGGKLSLSGHRGSDYTLNGKRRGEGALSDRDVISLAGATLTVEMGEGTPAPGTPLQRPPDAANGDEVEALKTLLRFSERMMTHDDVQAVLEEMMDAAISLTHADKGFLILVEPDRLAVRVARNLQSGAGLDLDDARRGVSDSIVAKVLETKKPIIVNDALHDEQFGQSESVVNLKLISVICAPLLEKGNLLGVLYLGNDRIAHRFEARSLELLTIFAAQASLIVRNALLVNELRTESAQLKKQLQESRYGELIGSCPGMREIFRRIDKVAATDISVLIGGETGTGKEMLAREIHRRSQRAKGAFVAINCGAIPENLLESELFGHVRGAFTGAVATRQGRFQAANGGTLFLDEVGDMPMALQVKILRALQERVVVKVGDSRSEAVDIRVVAATHRVLEDEVKAGRFREDLFYRLNVVKLVVPPLRDRGDDVLMLARWFLKQFGAEMKAPTRGFAKDAVEAMKRHAWPGNVRELENRLKKAIVLSDRAQLTAEDLDLTSDALVPVQPLAEAKAAFQRGYINQVLERNGGNRTKTAKDLGVDARTIFRHLERLEAERQGRTLPQTEEDRELEG
ncbi:MAG: sigma 54-interacting transcriptional regulator [Myxococcales bacterium]